MALEIRQRNIISFLYRHLPCLWTVGLTIIWILSATVMIIFIKDTIDKSLMDENVIYIKQNDNANVFESMFA